MGVFTFVCKHTGGEWTAKQFNGGDMEASSASTYDLQRKLVQSAIAVDSSGGVQSSFSYVTPKSAVFQVIVGGAVIVGGGVAASAPAASSGPAAEAPAAAKKEEKVEEEEEDDDMGFSLFD